MCILNWGLHFLDYLWKIQRRYLWMNFTEVRVGLAVTGRVIVSGICDFCSQEVPRVFKCEPNFEINSPSLQALNF